MYQQNQRNIQLPLVPSRNLQNVSSSGGYRTVTPQSANNFSIRNQNQMQQYQYVSPNFNPLPLERNTFYNENLLNQSITPRKSQPRRNNVTATIVQPVEYGFNNHENVVSNSHNASVPYFPNNNQQNNFAMPKTFEIVAQPVVFLHPNSGAVKISKNNKNFGDDDKSKTKHELKHSANVKTTAVATRKGNENEKIRIFTGTAEKVIKWHRKYNDYICYYELIASIISIQEGTVRLQKILLLRDKNGPIIQVVHYVNDHINIENFEIGQMLRCVGHMVGPSMMHGLSIREATTEEVATLKRMCYISDHAITRALQKA